MRRPHALTADERLAAEAAWYGRPLDPIWSAPARAVYAGMALAKLKREMHRVISEHNAVFVQRALDLVAG
ncbi:MAG: hypothetical protein ACKOBZ_08990 [Nitrospira sp.]